MVSLKKRRRDRRTPPFTPPQKKIIANVRYFEKERFNKEGKYDTKYFTFAHTHIHLRELDMRPILQYKPVIIKQNVNFN